MHCPVCNSPLKCDDTIIKCEKCGYCGYSPEEEFDDEEFVDNLREMYDSLND